MWMSTRRRAGTAIGAAAATAVLLCSPVHAATNESGQAAVWTPKELRFVYTGFTSRYSCDGLRDDVRSVLLELGARSDVKVDAICAEASGVPTTLPGSVNRSSNLTVWPRPTMRASRLSSPRRPNRLRRRTGRLRGGAAGDAGSSSGSDVDMDNGPRELLHEVPEERERIDPRGVAALERDLERVLADQRHIADAHLSVVEGFHA